MGILLCIVKTLPAKLKYALAIYAPLHYALNLGGHYTSLYNSHGNSNNPYKEIPKSFADFIMFYNENVAYIVNTKNISKYCKYGTNIELVNLPIYNSCFLWEKTNNTKKIDFNEKYFLESIINLFIKTLENNFDKL